MIDAKLSMRVHESRLNSADMLLPSASPAVLGRHVTARLDRVILRLVETGLLQCRLAGLLASTLAPSKTQCRTAARSSSFGAESPAT